MEIGTFTLGGLGGLILGTFLGHSLAIRRTERQKFNEASIIFREAFDSSLYRINRGEPEVAVIEDTFKIHIEASMKFRHHLHSRTLNAFDAAWKEYQNWYDIRCNRTTTEKLFPEYNDKYITMKDTPVLPLINNILKFTKPHRF